MVDDFDYSTQNSAYNDKFREWRKNSENPYAFGYKDNKLETVYVTGRGFVENSALDAEKNVILRIFNILGIAALIWVVIDNTAPKLIALLMNRFGCNINNNFFSSSIYGGKKEILIVLMVCGVLRLILPTLYLHLKLRLPRKVEFMGRLNDPMALLGTLSATLIFCTAVSIPVAYSGNSKEIYEYFARINADIYVWDQKELIIYIFFDVIVVSVLSELLFRGGMFAVLRQFGDPFAIVITAVTSAMLTQDFIQMPAVFLISLAAGYGLITSGTIFTAAAVHMIYKLYTLTLTVIELDTSDKMPLTRNLFMIAALVIGAAGLAVYWFSILKRKKKNIALYRSELSFGKRSVHAVKTFPYSAVALICIVCAVIKAGL